MNAFKHGRRSKSVLLPGDDAAEFEERRRELYATYRPLTPVEARCVDRIAASEWRMERWQRWEQGLNSKLDDLLEESPDGPVAQHNNPDTHHWQHRSTDCTLQEMRLDRSMLRAERRLYELQRMRRNRLVAPAKVEEMPVVPGVEPEAEVAVVPVPTLSVPVEPAFADVAPTGVVSVPSYPPLPGAMAGNPPVSGRDSGTFPAAAMVCSYGAITNSDRQKETPAPKPRAPVVAERKSAAIPENWVTVRRWGPPDGPAEVSSAGTVGMVASGHLPTR